MTSNFTLLKHAFRIREKIFEFVRNDYWDELYRPLVNEFSPPENINTEIPLGSDLSTSGTGTLYPLFEAKSVEPPVKPKRTRKPKPVEEGITEGKTKKGGINRGTQIKKRPPSPAPIKSKKNTTKKK